MKRRFAALFVCLAAFLGLFSQTAVGADLSDARTAVNAGRIKALCAATGDFAHVEAYNQAKGTLKATLEIRGTRTTEDFVFYDKTGAVRTMDQVRDYAKSVGVTFTSDGSSMKPGLRLPCFYEDDGTLALCLGMGLGSEKSGENEDLVLVYTGSYELGVNEVRYECMNMAGQLRWYPVSEVRLGSDIYDPEDVIGRAGFFFTAVLTKSGGYRLTWSPATLISAEDMDPGYISGVAEGIGDILIYINNQTRFYDVRGEDSGKWKKVTSDYMSSAVKKSGNSWYFIAVYEGTPEGTDPAMAVYMVDDYPESGR